MVAAGASVEVEGCVVTALLRTPERLEVVLNRPLAPFLLPEARPSEASLLARHAPPYGEERLAFDAAPRALVRDLLPIARAWRSLARVASLASAWDAVCEVLANSVLALRLDGPPPALEAIATEPQGDKRTAANPRGYRGTKRRPPKQPAARALDLRPQLCSSQSLAALAELAQRAGLSVRGATSPFELEGPLTLARFLWPLRRASAEEREAMTKHYWSLELESDAPLRLAVSRLLALAPADAASGWCALLESLPPERRCPLVTLVIERDALRRPPSPTWADALRSVDGLATAELFPYRALVALRALQADANPRYLLDGMRIANAFTPTAGLEALDGPDGTWDAVCSGGRPLLQEPADRYPNWLPMALWRCAALLPDLPRALALIDYRDLDPEHQIGIAEMVLGFEHHGLGRQELRAKWAVARSHLAAIVALLAAIPRGHRDRASACLRQVLWDHDEPRLLARALERCGAILPDLCADPWPRSSTTEGALSMLLLLGDSHWAVLRDAWTAWQPRLEAACRRAGDRHLVELGLKALVDRWPELVATAARDQPTRLFRLAKTLGALPRPLARSHLASIRREPLFADGLEELGPLALLARVEPAAALGVGSAIPRRLREHRDGGRPLRPAQLERDRRSLLESLPALRLEYLRASVLRRLDEPIGLEPKTNAEQHALLIRSTFDAQRRMSLRALRSYALGERDFVRQHPLSRAYWKRHPAIDEEVWRRGFETSITLAPWGPLELAVEQDLLEQLRLGTYVGSCLALGGIMAYSAAAAALDVNKRVVYARTRQREVVGRQVLALSDDEALVCFEVFPESAPRELKAAFRDFDRELARRLELPIFAPGPDVHDPEVACILSQEWWYDHTWNLDIETDASRARGTKDRR